MLRAIQITCKQYFLNQMTHQYYPYPSPKPLEKLRVHNNLTINAERWRLAHNYHNQRQNILYQSLHQPGIIKGLEVKVIPSLEKHHKIEIQPGIAIDISGNPIIVDSQINRVFTISLTPPNTGTQIIYIVIKYYVPADDFEHPSVQDTFVERFRLDAIRRIPQPEQGEIELCRIELNKDFQNIEIPKNFLEVGFNEIDFRYRVQAQLRPLSSVRLGVINYNGNSNSINAQLTNLKALVESLPGLFPSLQGSVDDKCINLNGNTQADTLNSYDLLYLTGQSILDLDNQSFTILKNYQLNGGFILIEADNYIYNLKQDIQNNLLSGTEELIDWNDFKLGNYLANKPFLFTQLPDIAGNPVDIHISTHGGVMQIIGLLTNAWGGMILPRHEIRDCQELGINILHFALQRRNFHQLIQLSS